MTLKLYLIPASFPVRAVLLCANALGLDLKLVDVDIFAGEHLKPEFAKINPQCTVPVLDDDGFILWDSHAIMSYLVGKYGKNDTLYPKDYEKRAIIDQRLHFDTGTLFPRVLWLTKGVNFFGLKEFPKDRVDDILAAYKLVEIFLEKNEYVAGNFLSIADFSIVSTITSANIVVPIEVNKFPKITAWIKKMEALPYYNANQDGLDQLRNIITFNLSKSNVTK